MAQGQEGFVPEASHMDTYPYVPYPNLSLMRPKWEALVFREACTEASVRQLYPHTE